MKKALLCFFLISCIFLEGCFSYRDINNVVFVTAMIFDVDNENRPVIYLEIFKPAKSASKSTEKAQRLMIKGTGKTVFEAVNDANLASSYVINYTQNKAIIYTQRAAEYGINNFFDIYRRDIQFIARPYIAVYVGNIQRFITSKFKEDEYIGLFLWDLINNIGASSRTVQLKLNDFLSRRGSEGNTNVMTVIKIAEDQPNKTLVVEGGAIVKNDKMVGILPKTEGEAYNFLINQVSSGSMEVSDPHDSSKFISLRILQSHTTSRVSYDGKTVNLKKIIYVNAEVIESQAYIDLTDDEIKKIETGAEGNIISACTYVFNKYKAQNLDIFMVGDKVLNKYGEEGLKDRSNIIKITNLEIEPHVKITTSGKTRVYR